MSQNQKHYVVWEGWNTGIFTSWPDCYNSVQGYHAPKYKGYDNHFDAAIKYNEGPPEYYYSKQRKAAMASLKQQLTNPAVAPTLPTPAPANDSLPEDQTALCIHVVFDQALGDVFYHYAWNNRGVERNLPPFKRHFILPGISVGWAEFDALIFGWAHLLKNGHNDCYLYTYNEAAFTYAGSIYNSQGTRSSGLDERIIRGNPLLWTHFENKIATLAKRPNLAKVRLWNCEKWGINPATKSALIVRIPKGSLTHIVNLITGK